MCGRSNARPKPRHMSDDVLGMLLGFLSLYVDPRGAQRGRGDFRRSLRNAPAVVESRWVPAFAAARFRQCTRFVIFLI